MGTDLPQKAAQLRTAMPQRPPKPPPADKGLLLGKIPRDDGEIRISWMDYKDSPFLRLQFWKTDSSGYQWPVKGRSFSVRIQNLPHLAEAVAKACDLANEHLIPSEDWPV